MRLVSWDGKRDVSYENCHLVINPKTFEIEAITGNTNFEPVMGIYSTEAKALKVMEMLREAYVNNEYYKSLCSGIAIPLPNNSDDMKEKMVATRTFRATMIFRFPKNEEIEVDE